MPAAAVLLEKDIWLDTVLLFSLLFAIAVPGFRKRLSCLTGQKCSTGAACSAYFPGVRLIQPMRLPRMFLTT